MKNWSKASLSKEDMVLSSRIRLARNIFDIPFPNKLSKEKGRELSNKISDLFLERVKLQEIEDEYKKINLWESKKIDDRIFYEKRIISRKLINNKEFSSFIYNKEETKSILINEEDHIRIQTITGGLDLKEAYKEANIIDDSLEEKLDYAFHEYFGFLTACPTNIGTGLRASVMIHLPATTRNKEIRAISNNLNRMGMVIRGSYGEGTEVLSNLYQISNQVTLGITEEDMINNLEGIVSEVINQENKARENLNKNYKYELEDKVARSLAILKSSVLITYKEALELLSNVRMGVEMGILNVEKEKLNELLFKTSSYYIEWNEGRELSEREKNIIRSNIIKEKIK